MAVAMFSCSKTDKTVSRAGSSTASASKWSRKEGLSRARLVHREFATDRTQVLR